MLLLAGLSSSFASAGAKYQGQQTRSDSGPSSIRSGSTPLRNHALNTLPGQRLAADISKTNRSKRVVLHVALTARQSGVAVPTVEEFQVSAGGSVSYFSFRASRTGGRAPPVSA